VVLPKCPRGPDVIDNPTVFAYRIDGVDQNELYNDINNALPQCEMFTGPRIDTQITAEEFLVHYAKGDWKYPDGHDEWRLRVTAKAWVIDIRGKPVDRIYNSGLITAGM
jgi:hypothetical protein